MANAQVVIEKNPELGQPVSMANAQVVIEKNPELGQSVSMAQTHAEFATNVPSVVQSGKLEDSALNNVSRVEQAIIELPQSIQSIPSAQIPSPPSELQSKPMIQNAEPTNSSNSLSSSFKRLEMEMLQNVNQAQRQMMQTKSAAEIDNNSSSSRTSQDRSKRKSLEKRKLRSFATDLAMREFWKQRLEEMQCIDEEVVDFKDQSIPAQRCKEIFDAEKKHLGLNHIFCDGSAILTLSQAAELLVLELAKRSYFSRENPEDKSPIKVEDVLIAIRDHEVFDLFAEHL
jgi:hypothetical protein